MKIKFSERFFCPAPWTMMYYHINNTTPCHIIRNNPSLGPTEYLKSEWLNNIKQDFVNGVVPESCTGCKSRENLGLKSTRGSMWNYFNTDNEPEMDISQYTVEKLTEPSRIEIRSSNLCNFKCRMCGEHSSSEIAKEKQNFSIPIYLNGKKMESSICQSPQSHIQELKNICFNDNLNKVVFTGGEPLLIKEYYDFMDFLIENNLNEKIVIQLYTNCSVYNELFVDRLLKFKCVEFIMSIDGVKKTAEYQRHGTKWDSVRENIFKFNSLPVDVWYNVAISTYVLLDVSSLANFLMELYTANPRIQTKCYSVLPNQLLHHRYMNSKLRKIAIKEIDQAITILTPSNFKILVAELQHTKENLLNIPPEDSYSFVNFTNDLDAKRNESFKDVFGYEIT